MTDNTEHAADPAIREVIQGVLDQVATLRVAGITYTPTGDGGTLAHVTVEGRTHEILCELTRDGALLSARVVEL